MLSRFAVFSLIGKTVIVSLLSIILSVILPVYLSCLYSYHPSNPIKPLLININLNRNVTVNVRGPLHSTEGAPWTILHLGCTAKVCHTVCVSYLPFTVFCEKGEATGWGWDVFNALDQILLTVSGTPSLMWNRHLENVTHAVTKGWCADGETASCRGFADYGSASVSVLSRGSGYEI